jgi:hypothetical protein
VKFLGCIRHWSALRNRRRRRAQQRPVESILMRITRQFVYDLLAIQQMLFVLTP